MSTSIITTLFVICWAFFSPIIETLKHIALSYIYHIADNLGGGGQTIRR